MVDRWVVKVWFKLLHINKIRIPKQTYRMLVSSDSDGKSNWVTKLRLLSHETGFGYVWLTQDVCNFIRIFRQRLTDMNLQGWVAGLNRSSSFDYCREFNTASNAEMYLDCVKQEAIRDCLGRVRSGISNPKVHYLSLIHI